MLRIRNPGVFRVPRRGRGSKRCARRRRRRRCSASGSARRRYGSVGTRTACSGSNLPKRCSRPLLLFGGWLFHTHRVWYRMLDARFVVRSSGLSHDVPIEVHMLYRRRTSRGTAAGRRVRWWGRPRARSRGSVVERCVRQGKNARAWADARDSWAHALWLRKRRCRPRSRRPDRRQPNTHDRASGAPLRRRTSVDALGCMTIPTTTLSVVFPP